MPAHDIVVIGTSAGGVEALKTLVQELPSDLPAAVFIVMHVQARVRSHLPEILRAAGSLPAVHPEDSAPIQHGRIYIAPPDRHLILERDHVHLSMGPKEEHHRPCINVLFRSAALNFGERVAGVILTGELDDGVAGLFEIKRRGGVAIVQNPEEATSPSMPLSALREMEADYTVSVKDMGKLISRLAQQEAERKRTGIEGAEMESKLTDLTCPDCRGTIWEEVRGNTREYFCRVGHRYSAKSMLTEHFAAQEKALYAAVVALEEGASLAARLAHQFEDELRDKLLHESREHQLQAQAVRRVLEERQTFNLD